MTESIDAKVSRLMAHHDGSYDSHWRMKEDIRTELAAVQSDHEIRHWAEEYECTIKCLDDAKVPKSDSEGGAYSLWGRIQAYCTTQPASGEVTDAEITQAVARGWIHYKNCDKEMDVDLAFAISEEISKLLAVTSAKQEGDAKDALRYRWLVANKVTHNGECWHFNHGPILWGRNSAGKDIEAMFADAVSGAMLRPLPAPSLAYRAAIASQKGAA